MPQELSGGSQRDSGAARVPVVSLLTRILLWNGAVLVVATAVLALTPATVSAPIALHEAVVLVAGVTAMLLVNLFLLRRTLAPLRRLTELMHTVEPLRPGTRVAVYGDDTEIVKLTSAFNDMLDRLERERRESLRRSLAAQEGERQRVAQELHDEIGQSLTALLLQIERLARKTPADLRHELEDIRETTRTTLEEVREVARRLRPEVLDDLGLANALSVLCERLSHQSGLPIERQVDRALPMLPQEVELVIYRVAQEALTNTLRHAHASRAEFSLTRQSGRIKLCVRDDGRGLDGIPAGAGIQGMRERAVLVGATCDVRNRRERGTEVCLEFELEPT